MNIPFQLLSWFYALTLLSFPRRHRLEYRADMLDTFRREVAGRHQRLGAWQAIRFAIAASFNAISAGLGERRRCKSGRTARAGFRFSTLGPDLIHASRSLWKAKAFSFVGVVSLGIGMGTVLLIMVFLRVITGPPPLVNTRGLVELLITPQGELRTKMGEWAIDRWSYPDFAEVRDADSGMAITGWTLNDTVLQLPTGGSMRQATLYASPNYFKTIGVALARGREFDTADDSRPVVIVSGYLWRNSLGLDPDIVGKTLVVDGVPRVVVGLAPEGFRRHLSSEEMAGIRLFLPLSQHPRLTGPASAVFDRELDWVRVLGRLQPGISMGQANAAVSSIMTGIAARHPATNALKQASVEPYSPLGARSASAVVVVRAGLLGISGVVLLVVCLNISGMVMVRSARRERELAVRLAMGASRARLIQYLLAESLVLAVLGGTLAGLVLYGTPAIVAWGYGVPIPDPRLRPDAIMVLVGVGLCFVTSLIFGLVPAIRFSRPSLVTTLKDEAGGGGRRVGRAHRITTAIQAAIAIPFLVICGLKLDNVRTTATADLGFTTAGLYALPVDGPEPRALVTAKQTLETSPDIQSVTVADGLPLDFNQRSIRVARAGEADASWAHVTRVDTRYFETMGIKLLSGRPITAEDRSGRMLVTVLSEPLARQLFAGGNALGQLLTLTVDDAPAQSVTVVGISNDLVASQMGSARPQLFLPLAQHPAPRVTLIARSPASPESVQSIFQRAFPDLDQNILRASFVTGDKLVSTSMWDLFSHSAVAGVCGLIALALTALGVFGVVGFMVATRTREIGVRIALGASRPRVLGMVLLDTVKLVVPGVLIGLLPAAWALRQEDFAYYSLGITEPLIYAFATGLTLATAVISALPSARRAAKVEPIVAMKAE
jgi:predicted permease